MSTRKHESRLEVTFPTEDEVERKLNSELLGSGRKSVFIKETFNIGLKLDLQGCLRIWPKRPEIFEGVEAKVDSGWRPEKGPILSLKDEEELVEESWPHLPMEEDPVVKRLEEVTIAQQAADDVKMLRLRQDMASSASGDRLWAQANAALLQQLREAKGKAKQLREAALLKDSLKRTTKSDLPKPNKFIME